MVGVPLSLCVFVRDSDRDSVPTSVMLRVVLWDSVRDKVSEDMDGEGETEADGVLEWVTAALRVPLKELVAVAEEVLVLVMERVKEWGSVGLGVALGEAEGEADGVTRGVVVTLTELEDVRDAVGLTVWNTVLVPVMDSERLRDGVSFEVTESVAESEGVKLPVADQDILNDGDKEAVRVTL
jgi:hypothetical protein